MSTAVYDRFLDWVPDPVWVLNADHQLVAFNEKATQYFRAFNNTELCLGLPVLQLFPDAMQLEWKAWTNQALAGEAVIHRLIYDFQGELLRFLIHFKPITATAAHGPQVLIYAQDLTKVQKEVGMNDLERDLLEYTLSSIEDGLFDWNLETGAIYFSHRWCAMLGYAEAEVEPNLEQLYRLIHPEDLEGFQVQINQILRRQESQFALEYRMQCANGGYKWILGRGRTLTHHPAKAGRFVGTHIDITAKKALELEQKRHERLLKALYQASTLLLNPATTLDERMLEALALIGDASRVQRIHLFKYLPSGGCMRRYYWDAQKGGVVNQWTKENQRQQFFELPERWATLLKEGQVIQGRTEKFPDQEQFYLLKHGVMSVLMVPVMVADENWGFIAFDDLSSNREFLDANIQVMMNFGIAIGHAKTRDYFEGHFRELNEQLSQKNIALEQSIKELDQFAYIISHDLKAPLRAINNLADWIEEDLAGKIEADVAAHLRLLKDRSMRMGQLIDGVLKYSRAGREQSDVQTVNCEQLIADLRALLGIEANIQILTKNLPLLQTDKLKLQQVLANLLSNAVKYGRTEGAIIEISYQKTGDHGVFCVKDNGPGLPPEYHEKIFNIFTMLDKPKDDSTGIGLAIVKKIVEEKGGRVWVASRPGEGASFYFEWKE
ncbi:MAG: ATP-binding protein [Sphingobacteriaceae bacterium]|nr:ATP-binding protein [Sphingobacteriaceae bacterium]